MASDAMATDQEPEDDAYDFYDEGDESAAYRVEMDASDLDNSEFFAYDDEAEARAGYERVIRSAVAAYSEDGVNRVITLILQGVADEATAINARTIRRYDLAAVQAQLQVDYPWRKEGTDNG